MIVEQTEAVRVNRSGQRETEKQLIAADGVSFMVNEDGSLSIELYKDNPRADAICIRLTAADAKHHRHNIMHWGVNNG